MLVQVPGRAVLPLPWVEQEGPGLWVLEVTDLGWESAASRCPASLDIRVAACGPESPYSSVSEPWIATPVAGLSAPSRAGTQETRLSPPASAAREMLCPGKAARQDIYFIS